jgi:hypothetical protein
MVHLGPSRVRAIYSSIPHIPLVIRNPVPFQERTKLLLKCALSVVLLLVLDVFDYIGYVGLADRKGPVSTLPMKISIGSSFSLDPFRRVLFQSLNHITQGRFLDRWNKR